MFKSALVAVALLASPALCLAQADTTWDIATGVNVVRSTTTSTPAYNYGWIASVAERPYLTHRWVGGEIEGSATYDKTSSTNFNSGTTTYTALAGPLLQRPVGHIRPRAHLLLGALLVDNSTTLNGQTASTTNAFFGNALGGGVDFALSRRVAFRTQADWLRLWHQSAPNRDMLRVAGGFVFSF